MQDDLQEQTRSRAAAQTRRRKRRIWVAGLCCTVAAATAYALTRPALTMTQQTFCGRRRTRTTRAAMRRSSSAARTSSCLWSSRRRTSTLRTATRPILSLSAGQEESEEHTHTEDCCQTQYELICPLEEGEAGDRAGDPGPRPHRRVL